MIAKQFQTALRRSASWGMNIYREELMKFSNLTSFKNKQDFEAHGSLVYRAEYRDGLEESE